MMKCSLFQCHSNYYYENACLMLSDDEEFENCLNNKRKRGELYYLYKKAIDRIVIETKQDCHLSSDHEKIEREEIKNDSEINSEELDDINIILKKNNCENMFNKNKCREPTKCVLPFRHSKNRVYSFPEIEKNNIECSKKHKYLDKKEKPNTSMCIDEESEMETENKGRGVDQNREDEMIEKFKEDLCNGLSDYFKDIFKNVENKESDMENKNEQVLIKKLNISDDAGLSGNFDNDIFLSNGLNSSSLNFEDSLPLTPSTENKKIWERQKEPLVALTLSEHNLTVFNKKKKEEEEILHPKRQHKQVEGLTDELDNYSLITEENCLNNTFKKKKGKQKEDEYGQIKNDRFSRFYTKDAPYNSFQTKKYNNTKKRKNNNNIDKNNNNIDKNNNNNNNKVKKRNKNEDFYYVKPSKKQEEYAHSGTDESCISPGKTHKIGVDRLEEVTRIRRKEKLSQNDEEKKHFPFQNFNRTVENIVRDNEINNRRNILRNNRKSKNMPIREEFEEGNKEAHDEDFIFVHFQKNVNNKILGKFLL